MFLNRRLFVELWNEEATDMNRPVHSAECLVERMDACLAARSVVHLVVLMEFQWVARSADHSVAL